MGIFSKIFKESGKSLKRYEKQVLKINELETELKKLSLEDIKTRSLDFKKRVREKNESPDDILVDAFALVRETAKRTLDQRHYDVQLIGGMVLHDGKIAEMLTGEGKTLASTLPIYLNGLTGKGAHVVTVNDYLAKRDTVWMGQIYHALGLSTACLIHDTAYLYDPDHVSEESSEELDKERDEMGSFKVVEKFLRPVSRKEAYEADITYGTNHEFGFDFLRDNITLGLDERVQRERSFVMIDEVDSILIDEARTPLIISVPDKQSSEFYKMFTRIVGQLKKDTDYAVDEKDRSVELTDPGIEKVEKIVGVDNIFAPENARMVHYLDECLKAKELFALDKDYVIKGGDIIIVDQFTGRLMEGRRYSGGLHQAIEAKEGVRVKEESRTYAQITIQNYFRLYKKLSGMTGTAQTSAEEFDKVYGLEVVSIPPNRPVVRKDMTDVIYKTKDAKYKAVVEDVKKRQEKGQPVLLGTTSIVNNEILSSYLSKAGVTHEVLNAKNHEREGEIIAQAGRARAVTVATNMAGRGVDIVFGGSPHNLEQSQKVRELGGLHVIGTERHEARRIDDQLRGRSGRQGDPGSSQFFLSLEDDLLRIFGGERIQKLMQTLKVPDDMPIESGLISKAVGQAQNKVEGMNLDIRRHLIDFDDVLNKQRTAIYNRRTKFLEAGRKGEALPLVKEAISNFVLRAKGFLENDIVGLKSTKADVEEIKKREKVIEELDKGLEKIPEKIEPERAELLGQHLARAQDSLWVDHLDNLQALRESVNIRAYAQKEPIVEYRREAYMLFDRLNQAFEELVFKTVFPIFELDITRINADIKAKAQRSRNQLPPGGKKVGRNDPCPCGAKKSDGSPVKYKHCHGK